MAGPIQSAAGRATVAQAALTTEVVDTALEIYSMFSGGGKGGGFSEQIASFAKNNSASQVSGKTSQTAAFKERLGAVGTAGGGQ